MEACVGAHHLSRKLQALGHDARLMPAKYVRAYSKGQKNDFRDAEAIAEAVQRPTMKFVATKTADQLAFTTIIAAPMAIIRTRCPKRSMTSKPLTVHVFQCSQSAASRVANSPLPLDRITIPLRATGSIRTGMIDRRILDTIVTEDVIGRPASSVKLHAEPPDMGAEHPRRRSAHFDQQLRRQDAAPRRRVVGRTRS